MLFVIGGMRQGQLDVAKKLLNSDDADAADCSFCSFEEPMSAEIIDGYHLLIKRMLKDGRDAYAYTESLLEANPDVCIVMDEIGCGVVPADPFEREYRETAGRIGCVIADRAESVYRVFCGIPTKLK
ncbi:MAG: bifunctional adenosylcobinamide kinase/adenosylcobinamide-phosphate guanylyltransferase [Lachnospiraceae bacterium]|nr:bifunctional adenosylcobinamide kinase/adenosylcobinamide-phosphate guanylyltransferase [Lachnospiraceae bacterium]